ncbi:hypothetical protein GAY28_02875 [Azospirillum brasilense]|nr:hypothetical protein [Azospirillum brasilense]
MSAPTNVEQYMLELVNRFRMNPQAELSKLINSTDPDVKGAITAFHVDLNLLTSQWASMTPQAPLAWNNQINDAARYHNGWMINKQGQQHQFADEPNLMTRLANFGYSANTSGENIYAWGKSVFYSHAAFLIDWGYGTGGIQDGYGHRQNLINSAFNEIGIAISAGSGSVGPMVITQNFGGTGKTYALGVVYDDLNKNGFYDSGEGVGGTTVQIGSQIVQTTASGGWQAEVGPGAYTVTFSGAGFASPLSQTVTIGSSSVKIDAETSSRSGTGTSVDGSQPVIAVNIDGVGGLATMSLYSGPVTTLETQWLGSAANEAVIGSSRNDFINLLAGNDAIDAGAGDDVLDGGTGSNFLTGGAGIDTFFIDGRGGQVTWGTITDCQKGEMVTLWGYKPGVSGFSWVDNAGADGFKGRTLHSDLDGNGSIDASITFSGATAATTNQFTILPGQVGDNSYLAVMYA